VVRRLVRAGRGRRGYHRGALGRLPRAALQQARRSWRPPGPFAVEPWPGVRAVRPPQWPETAVSVGRLRRSPGCFRRRVGDLLPRGDSARCHRPREGGRGTGPMGAERW